MRIKRIDFAFGLFVLAALAFNTPPTSALSLHSCQCSSEAQWQAQAILWSTGDHYLYNLDAQAIRKYNVHHRNGGTQPLAIGAGTSARMHHQAVAAGHAVPQAQNLVADQQPVEAIYLDAFADWVLAHELTDGTMKTTVTYDLGIHGTPIGFPE